MARPPRGAIGALAARSCAWLVAAIAALPLGTGCLAASPHSVRAAAPIEVALDPAGWRTEGHVEFARIEGFPHGLMKLHDDGHAVLIGRRFADGTIAFDAKLLGDGIPGIRFRQRDAGTSEVFYLRPDPDCRAANDCIQYVPIVHGVMPWDMYPQYQSSAPVLAKDWNHFRLVVSGRRMQVFVNGAATPTLTVGRLEGDARDGGIEFTGPAAFANLTIAPGATDGLPSAPAPDPTGGDPGLLRHWQVSPPSPLAFGKTPDLSSIAAVTAWQDVATEAGGLLNLSRLYGSPTGPDTGAVVWARTQIVSDRAQTRHVSLGFLREAWVFDDGTLVFGKANLYYPESARLDPEGRLSLANGSFELPLHKGRNTIVIALNNILGFGHKHWGWGLQLRLDDTTGLTLPKR